MTESAEPYKEFMRDVATRFERAWREFAEQAERRHQENVQHFHLVENELKDLREESRAQRDALLRMLDRLDGGGAAPA